MLEFTGGSKKAQCTLATTTGYKSANGEYIKETQWHNIIAWGNLAEQMSRYLHKGTQVAVQGSIAYRSYKDAAGVEKYVTEIRVDHFLSLEKGGQQEAQQVSSDVPLRLG